MARRVFRYEGGGEFVPIERDGPDERQEWQAVRRFVRRKGSATVSAELEDGRNRNAGVLTWDDVEPMTLGDFWEWLDDWAQAFYIDPRVIPPDGGDVDPADWDDDERPAVVGATVMT